MFIPPIKCPLLSQLIFQRNGAHIVQSDPSGEVVEVLATSIGARSQSARTYLEKHLNEFKTATLDQLIEHALLALRDTLPAEDNLSKKNTSISIVGKDTNFKAMDDEEVQPYLDRIVNIPRAGAQEQAVPGEEAMQH